MTDDHVIAQIRGGHDVPENIIRACQYCNSGKGKKTGTEYINYRKALGQNVPRGAKLLIGNIEPQVFRFVR